ncbi:MAG TPA: dTMP kinase [Kofleriaceae bacterium]|nr:dTMP kinase [Kofleriaceae bacterium]
MGPRLLPRGLLIAFEGIDGAGKTTQASRLAANLRAMGIEVVESKEPTNGHLGTELRRSASTGRLSPERELELFVLDRREHVRNLIEPALADGKVVIVDRYYFSTAAYQGARGMDFESILLLNESFAPQPDILFILEVSPPTGRARIAARGDRANLFEDESALAASAAIFARINRPYVHRLNGNWSVSELEHVISDVALHEIDAHVSRPTHDESAITQGDLLSTAESVENDDSIPTTEKAQTLLAKLKMRAATAS